MLIPHEFWMVWSPRSKRMPRVRHTTLASAVSEAQRLSALRNGRHFYVLACLGYAMVGDETPTPAQAAMAEKKTVAPMESAVE